MPRSTAALALLALGVLALTAGCGEPAEAAPRSVVGRWLLRAIDGEPAGDPPIRIEFDAAGNYRTESACHRAAGQYYMTERGVGLYPTEQTLIADCPSDVKDVLSRARAAFRASSRVSLRQDGNLVFFDQQARPRLLLARAPEDEPAPGEAR